MTGPEPGAGGGEAPLRLMVGGVSASGKSLMAAALAGRLGLRFIEGDDLHSDACKAKMHRGEPLDDADRAPWLQRVGEAIADAPGGAAASCSALKRAYRDALRQAAPGLVVLMLDAPRETLQWRLEHRPGHFMPASLLDSQLADLEPAAADEPRTLTIPDDIAPDAVLERMMKALRTLLGPRIPA